ncbi:class F sortase [Mangrovibacillus cuniculi]|uniref:Class F sortase n=1 Tax=Mangrovibacillus cuniculi TaxID=2593652 RepID=A0A7S8CE67_9BACI|nr:class F sortase [Mangrovibacillus cuniculi]QPC48347.1 class F sortase [Mangrovibacillus cuniculi]
MRKHISIAFAILLLSGCSAGDFSTEDTTTTPPPATKQQAQPVNSTIDKSNEQDKNSTEQDMPIYEGIEPARIVIPSLDIDAPITEHGLNENAEMTVPDNGEEVGWFEPGKKPGEKGNSILAAHVDDYTGPAVFFYLKNLKPGDIVEVYDVNDNKKTFEVEKLVAYDRNEAPIAQIFGPSQTPRLNLLTCTGIYDRSIQEHEERLVVYTTLIEG